MVDDPKMAACRILCLDDHTVQVKIFQKILEAYGFSNVVGISDPQQCMTLHQENPFDLVIVDLNMPVIDGFEIIKRLMDFSANNFLPIIVVTGSIEKKDMLRALQLGARDFVSRPVHREELIHRVSHLLSVGLAYKKIPSALRPTNARVDRRVVRQGRVLVLEDDASQRIIVEKMLKLGGFNDVAGLSDPTVLKAFIESQVTPFEMVVLDLHLPDISTKEAIDIIIQSSPHKNKPYFLAISSDDANEVRWDAFRDGVWDFVNKPLERDSFLARVENLVELRLLA